MKKVLLIILFALGLNTYAQDSTSLYRQNIKIADSLYDAKSFKASALTYSKAFSYFNRKAYPNDRYNAACSFALANEVDSAYYHLFRLTKKSSYSNLEHVLKDEDLNNLKNDNRWIDFIKQVTENKKEKEKYYDYELIEILDKVYESDQGARRGYQDTINKYGQGSEELQAYWDNMRRVDSINEGIVVKILEEKGWLGREVIGSKGNSSLFLVIQHADIETQKKYLPMMREAVKNKKASASSLALLEDRVALRSGEKQIYGSQVGKVEGFDEMTVLPLLDPANVDKRRATVSLGTLKEYCNRFGFEWNLEQYLNDLPKLDSVYFKNQ